MRLAGAYIPTSVLPRHAHNEFTDILRRRRSAWAPVLAAIVLGCDEAAVPAQKRSGCGNGRNLGQRLAAQSLGLDGEPTTVVVRELETLAPEARLGAHGSPLAGSRSHPAAGG